jgi:hypothetical protein
MLPVSGKVSHGGEAGVSAYVAAYHDVAAGVGTGFAASVATNYRNQQ